MPTIAGVQSAIADFSASYASINQNSFYTNIVDGPSAASYPIVGFTYLVFKFDWPADPVQQYETFRFFHWAMQVWYRLIQDPYASAAAASKTFATLTPAVFNISYNILSQLIQPGSNVPLIQQVFSDYSAEVTFRNRITCSSCVHGTCVAVDTCACIPTWNGTGCDTRDLPVFLPGISTQISLLILAVFNGLLILLCLFSAGGLYYYRKTSIIRASSSDLTYILIGFLILGHLAVYAHLTVPAPLICTTRVYVMPAATTGVIMCLALKLWRVYFIFGSSGLKARQVTNVKTLNLLMYLGAGVGFTVWEVVFNIVGYSPLFGLVATILLLPLWLMLITVSSTMDALVLGHLTHQRSLP